MPNACRRTTFGRSIDASAAASCVKACATPGIATLIATRRPRRTSRAEKTSPVAPSPISLSMR
jgi:hypothetical protein